MATVSSSLRLHDNFSGALGSVNKALDKTINRMERLERLGNVNMRINIKVNNITQEISALRNQMQHQLDGVAVRINLHLNSNLSVMLGRIQQLLNRLIATTSQLNGPNGGANAAKLEAALRRIAQLEERINQLQGEINNRVQQGGGHAQSWIGKLGAVAAAYVGINQAAALYNKSLEGAIELLQYQSTFQIRSGSQGLGDAIYENIVDSALEAGQNVNQALAGTNSFLANTVDPKQLVELNKLAARLEVLSPEQGTAGASFATKEFLSGDYVSLVERFEINRSLVRDSAAREAGLKGDVEGFIKGFDEILDKLNVTQEQMDAMADTPLRKWKRAVASFNYALSKAGQMAFLAFEPLIDLILKGFEDGGNFEQVFGSIQQGLYMISTVAANVISWMLEHWDLVKNALLAVGVVAAGVAVAFAIDWLIAVWPLALIVAAIALIGYALNEFGITTQTQVSAVAGYFYAFFTYIRNQIAIFWDIVIDLAEFFYNVWIDPVYAIKKLLYNLFVDIGKYFENAINSWSDGLNALIQQANKIPGVEVGYTFGKADITSGLTAPTSDAEGLVDLSKYKMGQKNVFSAFEEGYAATDKAIDAASKFSLVDEAKKLYDPDAIPKSKLGNDDDGKGKGKKGKKPNVGTVDKVKKIDKEVDISSEDLKMMRELAEMKSIQNFVTLTPTVQVKTGDINSGADLDTIIGQISTKLEENFVSTAEGVYE